MKTFYLATVAAFALVPLSAKSADLNSVLKAPSALFEHSGWYMGLATVGETSKGEVSVPALGTTGSITTAGAGVGVVGGYHKGTVEKFYQIEAYAHWMNLGGEQVVTGSSVKNEFQGGGRLKLGGTQTYANLMALLGNIGLNGVFQTPAVGAGVGQNTMPYAYVGFNVEKPQATILGVVSASDYQVTPEVGMGVITRIMNPATGMPQGCAADASVGYSPAGKGFGIGDGVLGGGLANQGRSFKIRGAVIC